MNASRVRFLATALCAPVLLVLQWPLAGWSKPVILEESARLVSPEPQLPLNGPVAVHGNILIAGSVTLDEATGIARSAAFVFERASSTSPWTFVRKLIEHTQVSDAAVPLAVAVQGTLAAVASRDAAHVFERTSAGWAQTPLPAPANAEAFGSDVAISAGAVALGGISGGLLAGFVYQKNVSGQWLQTGQVTAGVATGDESVSGPDLDIFADQLVVGSPVSSSGSPDPFGRLYIFRRQADGTWLEIDRIRDHLLPSGPNAGLATGVFGSFAAFTDGIRGVSVFAQEEVDSWFVFGNVQAHDRGGIAAALDLGAGPTQPVLVQPMLAIGAPADEDRGRASGSVTLHYRSPIGDQLFIPAAKLLASDARTNLALGAGVSFHRNTLVAASRQGRVYVYRVPSDLTAPALMQDDFEDGNFAGWHVRSSVWNVVSSLGSRVFRQTLNNTDARATLENVDWTNQSIQADVRPLTFNGTDRWIALIVRYTDDNNYYYVTLRNTNRVRLSRRVNGTFRTLAEAPLTVAANRDYRVRLEAVGTWLRVYVNSALLLQARDRTFTHGTVGLRTYFARADYDNIVASPIHAMVLFEDDFEDNILDGWTTQPTQSWAIVPSGTGRALRQSVAPGDARAITGIPYASNELDVEDDQIIEARARALSFITGGDPWFGLIARFRNDRNFVHVTVNRNGFISLRKLVGGATQVLDTAPMTVTTGTRYALRLEAIGRHLRVYVNGRLKLDAVDNVPGIPDPGGQYGLMTSGASAEFDDVRVTQP